MKKMTCENVTTYIMKTLRGYRHMMVCLEKNGYTLANKESFFDRKYIYKDEEQDAFNTDYISVSTIINLKLEEI